MGERLGQHFLKSEDLLKEIAEFAEISGKDVVLEIGAAFGNLTKYLSEAKKVYAVELDKILFEELRKNMHKFPNIECINIDVLKYEFPKDVNKIVGNLPYEISSPVTEKVLEFLNEQKRNGMKNTLAVLMYQREFAERMTSFPGLSNYSRLSVLVNYYADAKIVKMVPKTAFRPAPKIESALIRLEPLGTERDEDMFLLAKVIFMHRNKKLLNALVDSRDHLKIKDKEKLRELLPDKLGELANKKVFYLEIDELQKIAKKLKGILI
jgi:16S rRNA (adenine1518-N6/adenine1519-N6)-dimethyltransferase